ncbi:AraC family transcriptional regulator of adaptative response / methylphosphotriester-DNA alkyltransferase methyltransferase [Paenibacillus phyllosphaerae]|uniref:AraC family transcriptional regulator of adaptative response / methylphosphotriester-DNA alkyltransferase methyltransferase n=1 Tax=Paenibacillus phyllosphaerae TaxID=274593 RepID=A0A7W5AZK6_9BACL|nr:bifunctional transcriptional activator/DNA repair enzyme AdaA [Paenibacillus phyllosphaerae]MBB3111181.1 AraC family transcriptional regulator of adaptative response / methylphosphotriester-DNA alkyltransferase methyltransferase [Paenibacillus phyllosphaerae]
MEQRYNMQPEEAWKAIIGNDAAYNSRFLYAVVTTGIFCRPSCKSKPPKRENVRIFPDAKTAQAAGYRPCKRCKPTDQRLPDEEWLLQITAALDANYDQPLTLADLADICHGSPYHLQRTFKQRTGITPVAYLQNKRIEAASRELLHTDRPVAEIAASVGLPNTAYFITLFKKLRGFTPREYRNQFRQEEVTPNGSC